jgi:hypothetical protein
MQQFAALQPGPAGKTAIGPPNPNDAQPLIGNPTESDAQPSIGPPSIGPPSPAQPASPGDRGGVIPGGNIPVSGFVPPDDTFFFPPADIGPNINPQPRFGAPPDLQSPGLNPVGGNPLPGSPANDSIDELLANHPGLNPNRPGQGNDLGSSGSWEMDFYDFGSDIGNDDLTLNPDGTPMGVEGMTFDPYPTGGFVPPGAPPPATLSDADRTRLLDMLGRNPDMSLQNPDPVAGQPPATPVTPPPGGGGGATPGPVTPGPVAGQPPATPVTPGPVAGQPPATPVTPPPDGGDDWWKKGAGKAWEIGKAFLPPWIEMGIGIRYCRVVVVAVGERDQEHREDHLRHPDQ